VIEGLPEREGDALRVCVTLVVRETEAVTLREYVALTVAVWLAVRHRDDVAQRDTDGEPLKEGLPEWEGDVLRVCVTLVERVALLQALRE
jgi:hypothetical protein